MLGLLLVSTPVTIDAGVPVDTTRFVALTLAMAIAILFNAESIAPVLLILMKKAVTYLSWTRIYLLHLCQA